MRIFVSPAVKYSKGVFRNNIRFFQKFPYLSGLFRYSSPVTKVVDTAGNGKNLGTIRASTSSYTLKTKLNTDKKLYTVCVICVSTPQNLSGSLRITTCVTNLGKKLKIWQTPKYELGTLEWNKSFVTKLFVYFVHPLLSIHVNSLASHHTNFCLAFEVSYSLFLMGKDFPLFSPSTKLVPNLNDGMKKVTQI